MLRFNTESFYHLGATNSVATEDSFVQLTATALTNLDQLFNGLTYPINVAKLRGDDVYLDKQIRDLNKLLSNEQDHEKNKEYIQLRTLLLDYKKIKNLRLLDIPYEKTSGTEVTSKQYFTLADSAGGVTEKVALITPETAKQQLQQLASAPPMHLKEYIENRNKFKLNIEAIIKLPKHQKITEVQREAIALNISKILGFDTSKFTFITYEHKPALLIPFDKIELLSNYSVGETKYTLKGNKKIEYTHYSTIKPVGEGLQADQTIEDFGDKLAYFYLCSDPDSFGGYNQNKALKNGKTLFIFDQVVMSNDNFGIDSRISLFPSTLFKRHSRHFQGRNRTLVDDSSLSHKLNGVLTLISKKGDIDKMLTTRINEHQDKIKPLIAKKKTGSLTRDEKNYLKTLNTLRSDAIKLQKTLNRRIDSITKNFPKLNNHKVSLNEENIATMNHALVLEKLVNAPSLFTEDGRPYKFPWTYRNKVKIKNITTNEKFIEDDISTPAVKIKFDKKIDINFLKLLPPEIQKDIRRDPRNKDTILISNTAFNKLNESSIFTEQSNTLSWDINYLDTVQLKIIKNGYKQGGRDKAIKLIEQYHSDYARATSNDKKISIIEALVTDVSTSLYQAPNKGFLSHIDKKLQYDIQQKLQHIISKPDLNLTEAFNSAIKLDRVRLFNKVLIAAIKNNYTDQPQFSQYLNKCIELASGADNYNVAVKNSRELEELSYQLLHKMSPQEITEKFNPDGTYFDDAILTNLQRQYGQTNEIVSPFRLYIKNINAPGKDPIPLIEGILAKTAQLSQKHPEHKKFINKVSYRLQYDIFKHLLTSIKPPVAGVTEAFEAAAKLGKSALFNKILLHVIKGKTLNTDTFKEFLNKTNELGRAATSPEKLEQNQHLLEEVVLKIERSKGISKSAEPVSFHPEISNEAIPPHTAENRYLQNLLGPVPSKQKATAAKKDEEDVDRDAPSIENH